MEIGKPGIAGAKVVQGDGKTAIVQCIEFVDNHPVEQQRFLFSDLQHQLHRFTLKTVLKVQAIIDKRWGVNV